MSFQNEGKVLPLQVGSWISLAGPISYSVKCNYCYNLPAKGETIIWARAFWCWMFHLRNMTFCPSPTTIPTHSVSIMPLVTSAFHSWTYTNDQMPYVLVAVTFLWTPPPPADFIIFIKAITCSRWRFHRVDSAEDSTTLPGVVKVIGCEIAVGNSSLSKSNHAIKKLVNDQPSAS